MLKPIAFIENFMRLPCFCRKILPVQKKEVSLQDIVKNNRIDYEALRKTTDAVLEGTHYIDSLSLGEEQGRTKGGRRNVEASLLIGGGKRTDTSQQRSVAEQEKLLKEYAHQSGIWIDEFSFSGKLYGRRI